LQRYRAILPVLLIVFLWPHCAPRAATVADSLDSAPPRQPRPGTPTSPTLATIQPEIRYTADQIETVLARADAAWRSYRRLRVRLDSVDSHEQALAVRATALRAMTQSVERLLGKEKRKPTKEGAQIIADALNSLDRATAAVEYDSDRIALRMAQESLLPPTQPYCLCLAPAFARVSPLAPTACPPTNRASATLAAGEAGSFQLVIVPYWNPIVGVRIELSDLFRRDSIDRFGLDQIRFWLVESVAGTSTLSRVQFMPDPLAPLRPFDLPATVSQAVLVDIRARRDQPAGVYEGHLTVRPQNLAATSIALQIVVRPFTLPDGVPEVSFAARNESVQKQFLSSPSVRFIQQWQSFLSAFGLGLYRPKGFADSAEGWLPWPTGQPAPIGMPGGDVELPALYGYLPYRQTAWNAWLERQRRGSDALRWLVNEWVSLDPASSEPLRQRTAPFVRSQRSGKSSENPPGMIYVNRQGEPEPTVRLIVLRDGVEDYRYLALLARKIAETQERKAAGWWKRRRWKRLLDIDPTLFDPKRAAPEAFSKMQAHREKVVAAIVEAQRCLDEQAAQASRR